MKESTNNKQYNEVKISPNIEQEYQGIYGPYKITIDDKREVNKYRVSVLITAISFTFGLIQWIVFGPTWAWVWLISIAIGLGLSLNWIHIYISPLHQGLKLLWLIGSMGLIATLIINGPSQMLSKLVNEPNWIFAIGPLFAALTGLGFKEFFCFRRAEAIGLTALIPIALVGHLGTFLDRNLIMAMLVISSLLMTIMASRKFGMEAASDIGDKSVFEYLQKKSLLENS